MNISTVSSTNLMRGILQSCQSYSPAQSCWLWGTTVMQSTSKTPCSSSTSTSCSQGISHLLQPQFNQRRSLRSCLSNWDQLPSNTRLLPPLFLPHHTLLAAEADLSGDCHLLADEGFSPLCAHQMLASLLSMPLLFILHISLQCTGEFLKCTVYTSIGWLVAIGYRVIAFIYRLSLGSCHGLFSGLENYSGQ